MKPNLVLLGVVIVGAAAFAVTEYGSTLEVEQEEVEVLEPILAPDCLSVVGDQDACDAADAVIRKKELLEEETRLEAEIEALAAELAVVQKELGVF